MTSKHSSTSRLLNTGIFDGLNSFAEIEARISALPGNKERGDAFEIFAEAYLATQKIALAQDVWPFEAMPLEQRKALSLDTGRDMGVDGTYLTSDGELRAYQVKFRSNRVALTWEELSTFMGLTDQVGQRVLITNSEALPSLMQDRSGFIPIRGSDLDRLATEDFEAMRQWLSGGRVKLPRKQSQPHQQEALTAITEGLKQNDRATVVMACGTGKSLVALWAAEQHGCKTLLVLVPSLALVRQLLHEWLRQTAWERFTFMCVCSDPTVAKGADDLIVHQADLDFPVTTESAVVSKFLSKPFDGIKIVFSTYQSAQVVAEGMPVGTDGVKQPFDLAIFDEAHKTASRDGTRFSFALQDANLPIRKRLFFTATPRHYDIRKKDKEGDNTLVYSMDKPEIYGPVIHTLSFAEAARQDIICDYKVVISVVTSEMVNDHVLKHGEVIVAGDTVKARQVALQIALQKAVEKYGVSRIFTFHGSVAAARSFTSEDGEGIRYHLPDFTTLHVSGEMPTARREDQMKAFRQADKAVISNARCLTEGVDVPAVDMVAFISPRKSKVDIVQATGRAMRKSPGKEFGYVMVPLFVEQAANESIEEALHRTGFDDIWDLLGTMREQDDVLTDIIRQMREDKGKTGGYDESRFSERVEVLGPSVSLDTIRGAITAECLESLGISWDERFGELLAYKNAHGHVLVPKTGLTALDVWVSLQRQTQKSGGLSAERVRRLDEIGFEWDPLEKAWEAKFNEMVAYKAEHGDTNVSQNYSNDLCEWVATQRKNKKNEKLLPERERRLNEIGFVWDALEDAWESKFTELVAYKAKHGNLEVAATLLGLGAWVANQRQNLRRGILSSERKAQLDGIGFQWTVQDTQWESRFSELLAYKAEYGDANVPQHWHTRLGQWVSKQRQLIKNGSLTIEQKMRLEEIGFTLDDFEFRWEEKFNELVTYKAEHGNTNVPRKYKNGLGGWVGTQRKNQKINILTLDKKKRLDEIGFEWELHENAWEAKFYELVAYKAEYGDTNVPFNYPNSLGTWVGTQRQNQKKDKLTSDQKKRLEEVGFVWDVLEDTWEAKFNELVVYKAEHGDTNIPKNYSSDLYEWVATQRKNKKNEKLLPERKNRLHEIGFVWDALEDAWESKFKELVAYSAEHGNIKVPRNYPNGLGSWIKGQRKIKNNMPLERKARLEGISGWSWDALSDKWEEGFYHLKEFADREGHTMVPGKYKTADGYRVGQWVSTQRRNDNLSSERKALLEALPGWSWGASLDMTEEEFRYASDPGLI